MIITLLGYTLLLALAGLLFFFRKTRATPNLFFPRNSLWGLPNQNWTERLVYLPKIMSILALAALLIAWYDPKTLKVIHRPQDQGPPREGVLLFLALDRSGSMQTEDQNGLNRMDKLKAVVREFLEGRQNDLIGMLTFARIPKVLAPPTLDIDSLAESLDQISSVKTDADDGTAIGYAIYRAAQWVASTRHYSQELQAKGIPGYKIQDVALIVVTDGLQNPNPQDSQDPERAMGMDQAAEYAREQGIKLYIINIEPKIAEPRFEPELRQMRRAAVSTGGQFYFVNQKHSLEAIFKAIDKLQKSQFGSISALQPVTQETSLAWLWIGIGWSLLSLALLLKTTYLRTFP